VITPRGTEVVYVGQAQRPKVLRWSNRVACIVYVGQAKIADQMTNEWLTSPVVLHLGSSRLTSFQGDVARGSRSSVGKRTAQNLVRT